MSNPNRRGALALVSASMCLVLAALFSLGEPASPALSAAGEAAVPAAADWGLSFPTEGESPVGNATAEDLARYGAYYLGDTSKKVLYLTFDCGYENGNTEAILDALKKHDAPAAFFVVGHMVESAPDIVRRMAEEGHIVGNHTYHHPDMSAISDLASFRGGTGGPGGAVPGDHRSGTLPVLPAAPGEVQRGEPGSGPGTGLHHGFLEAWPMWTGTWTTSPRRKPPTKSCCPGSTTEPSSCSTPPPPTKRRHSG